MTEWQPIETMPEGEITCLVFIPEENQPIHVFHRFENSSGFITSIGNYFPWDMGTPTQWAPITPPSLD